MREGCAIGDIDGPAATLHEPVAGRGWDRIHVTSPAEDARARGLQPLAAAPAGDATPPVSSIVICTVPRSGSWLLAEALEATGVCGHPREYFRPDYQDGYARAWGLEVRSFADYLSGVLRAGTTPDGTFGVKLHWGQMAHLVERLRALPGAWGVRADADVVGAHVPGPRYVHLIRQDKARQAISLYKAVHLDVWWRFADDGPGRHAHGRQLPASPDLSRIAAIEATLRDHEARWERFFAEAGVEPIRVTYAELAGAYAATLTRLFDELAIARHARAILAPRLRRQADALTDEWERRYLAAGGMACATA